MTVNQKGRTERVYVNLEAIYPNPNDVVSIEELRAGHRGWLSKVWEPESQLKQDTNDSSKLEDHTEDSGISMDAVSREVSEKLVIARDPPMLDENGAAKESSREGRGRRMKIKEVNETQISELYRCMKFVRRLTLNSQGKAVIAIRTQDDEAESFEGTDHDSTYSSSYGRDIRSF